MFPSLRDRRQDSLTASVWLLVPAQFFTSVICLFFLLPISFYSVLSPATTARDPNWQIVLNYAFEQKWIFGSDISFTYGPLGFLNTRLAYPGVSNLLCIWDIITYASILIVLIISISSIRTLAGLLAATIVCAIVGISGKSLDYSILYFFFSLFFSAKFISNEEIVFGVLAWSCAFISLFLKASYGLIAISTILIPTIALIIFSKNRYRALVTTAIAAALFALMLFILPLDLISYLEHAYEFIRGYPDQCIYQILKIAVI